MILFDFICSQEGRADSGEDAARFRRKIYLGCTRALHELYFVERDALPDSLEECAPFMEMEDLRKNGGR